ncbi:olfactory receptor 8J2-like [Bombina bombina]|uniref:olfactory receptor 8J2-like n=1 Tax=Bombina bombina TaxID=8345 RepID=UPI00235AE102|nr:olfactory receptor 8J2-like [Bombina bombina]
MEKVNNTTVTYFILKGVSDIPELQDLVFLFVLIIYLLTVGGNLCIMLLVYLDPQLQTPMYFFLGHLSLIDISSATTNLHKIFTSYISGDKSISFFGCMAQFYFFSYLTIDELLILTAMSYDRYEAICNPLHYHMVMRRSICALLVALCYLMGCVETLPCVVLLSELSCFKSNIINHFFCDLVALMQLSCSDKRVLELYTLIEGSVLGSATPAIFTVLPYVFILKTIFKIRSVTGRQKAFYTCSSHLTVVILLYITISCQYLRPIQVNSLDTSKLFSFFNTAAVPLLNPLIYSLKNKEVKLAFKKWMLWFKTE